MIKSISDLKTTKPNGETLKVLGYYQPGDGGAGDFFYDDTCTEKDNGGTIIKGDQPGAWRRVAGREINVLWFGAKADGVFDNREIFQSAFAAASSVITTAGTIEKGTVYIPASTKNYFFSDSLNILYNINIRGDFGNLYAYPTRLSFPPGKAGVVIKYNSASVSNVRISDIEIMKDNPYADTTRAVGLWANVRVVLNNVSVYYFNGNGIEINTLSGGNSNSSIIENCQTIGNGLSGLFLVGGESNNCYIKGHLSVGNSRWGIEDNSFLGNNYLSIHMEANGQRPGADNVACIHKGKQYWSKKENVGIEPGVTPKWQDSWHGPVSGTSAYTVQWDAAKTYYGTGSIKSNSTVQKTCILASYTEGDQGPALLGLQSMWIGGNGGSGFQSVYSPYMDVISGYFNFYGHGVRVMNDQTGQDLGTTHIAMDMDKGFSVVSPAGYVSLNRDAATKTAKFHSQGSLGLSGLEFTFPDFPVSKFGWRADQRAFAVPIVSGFLGFRSLTNRQRIRTIHADAVMPTAQPYFAAGDICLNNGPDASIGWKYNGTKWEKIGEALEKRVAELENLVKELMK